MTDYARKFLIEILTAQGHDQALAEKTVESILGVQVASGMVSSRHLDDWEREAHAHHLRGKRVAVAVIALRVGMSERKVYNAIRRHQQRRRAALAA